MRCDLGDFAPVRWYTVFIARMDEFNKGNEAIQNQPVKPVEKPGGAGSIIGAIIIILLLAAGAFYFWGAKLNTVDNNPPPLILGNETADADTSSTSAS